jgi:adenylyltransferase/sulfurtransferase
MTIFIPTPLRVYVGGKSSVDIEAPTVGEAMTALTQSHPELRHHLFTEDGKLRAFVNLYLNDEDVRYLPARNSTAVTATDTLSISPSIAGGSGRADAAQARDHAHATAHSKPDCEPGAEN